MPHTVHVSAPSRLHFGMLAFNRADVRQFGGVGAMIDRPRLELTLRRANGRAARGPLGERAAQVAARVADALQLNAAQGYEIEVAAAPPPHAGLGTGTQLGLAVAAGMRALFDFAPLAAAELALLAGRGRRSAVGSYGFALGGLIVEAGRLPGERFAPLVARVSLPMEWRFVLIQPRDIAAAAGISGSAEELAFERLPPVAAETTDRLCREIVLDLLPSIERGDCDAFGESLFRYGHLAGSCFAARQGGSFASPELAELVARIRAAGVGGVGQTSWGPTLFALFPDAAPAAEFVARFRSDTRHAGLQCIVAAPDNGGAKVCVE